MVGNRQTVIPNSVVTFSFTYYLQHRAEVSVGILLIAWLRESQLTATSLTNVSVVNTIDLGRVTNDYIKQGKGINN